MKSPFSLSIDRSALNYSDIPNTDINKILQKLLGTKSKRWDYEQEIRIVTSQAGKQSYDFRALKSIYFGLRMPEELKEEVMMRLAGRGIDYHQIILNKNYKLTSQPLKDKYPDSKKYKYSIAPIADMAISPDLVNEKYKKYTDYLYKAAEIVRREPYCDLVEMVEFSWDKSTAENPIIFVQYKRTENRWFNHYLTLQEIDEKHSEISDL